MGIHLFKGELTERFVDALCNAFLHSIWQGLLLAAIAGLIVICTKKTTSAMRYNLLVSALFLFAAGVCITFFLAFKPADHTKISQSVQRLQSSGQAKLMDHSSMIDQARTLVRAAFDDINNFSTTIVLAWFLVICVKCIQLGIGLQKIARLTSTKISPLNREWNLTVERLAINLGIQNAITVLESGLAKVPMVIGHFKPVILLPLGLLTALSPDTVEAILIHELAHIKRRDYLVNLLQNLLEIMLFFNPTVIWVSNLIKTERENCCDDLALAQRSNRTQYVRALIACQEYEITRPAYAMSLQGSSRGIMNRVNRILNQANHSLNVLQKGILTICLVCGGLFFSAFIETTMVENISPPADRPTIGSSHSKSDRPNSAAKTSEIVAGKKQKLKNKATQPVKVSTAKHEVIKDQDSISGTMTSLKPAVIKLKLRIVDSADRSKSIPLVPKSTLDTTHQQNGMVKPVTKLKLQFSRNSPAPNINR